jgi:nitroreductase
METILTVASRREVRDYRDEPIPGDVVERILQAGRIAGSARNVQDRRFVVIGSGHDVIRASVTRPTNIEGAQLLVALVVGPSSWAEFDAGRAAQNMMLAAWDAGVGSCPNTVLDQATVGGLLGLEEGERVLVILSFGLPERPVNVDRRSADEWFARADRRPVDELVTELKV